MSDWPNEALRAEAFSMALEASHMDDCRRCQAAPGHPVHLMGSHYHCDICDMPSSMMGHQACRDASPASPSPDKEESNQ